jgi:N-acetylneuraminic acid mutarotase
MKISKNYLLLGLLPVAIATSIFSCGGSDDDLIGNWIELTDLIGNARYEAVSFTIGEIGYIGTGYDGEDRLKDFYAYDASSNNWSVIAEPPAGFVARISGIAFAASGKGYVGFGKDNNSELGDLWVYNPGLNTWDAVIADDAPPARYGAVAFTIDNIGYVGTGYNGNPLSDFYAYNPSTNTWTQKAYYPSKVKEAVAFVLDNKGYICTGDKNGTAISDFYMYDPSSNVWSLKRNIADVSDDSYDDDYSIVRKQAVAFTIGGKAYVTLGNNGSLKKDCWEYDPLTDLWTDRTSFEGTGRNDACSFTTASGRGFVVSGATGSSGYFDDLWEFKPTEELNEDD